MLKDGYTDVPAGKIATAVMHLEMRRQPVVAGSSGDGDASIRHVRQPDVEWYRDLYFRIGSDWLWTSRLEMASERLCAVIHDEKVDVLALDHDGLAVGLIELDFRVEKQCELAFFGLTPQMVGKGHGRHMMNHAISQAWSRTISRFWVHTCTLDHPAALSFYLRSGFEVYERRVEVADDPRVIGLLPRTAGPHVPIIDPRR